MTSRGWLGIGSISTAFVCGLVSAAPVGEAEVKQCVQDILQRVGAGACSKYLSLESVKKIDARETSTEAFVIADIVFRVTTQIGGTSQVATQCTGTGWRGEVKNPHPSNTGAWFMFQSQADMDGGYLEPGRGLMVEKSFKFERWESGWRCAESQMSPISKMWFVNAFASPSASEPQTGRHGQGSSPTPGQQDCKVFLYGNTLRLASPYKGGCKDGLAEGQGSYSYTTTDFPNIVTALNGEFHEGRLNGHVTQDRPGMHYEGEFRDNRVISATVNGKSVTIR